MIWISSGQRIRHAAANLRAYDGEVIERASRLLHPEPSA
jgi:hypothetical protein